MQESGGSMLRALGDEAKLLVYNNVFMQDLVFFVELVSLACRSLKVMNPACKLHL